MGHFHYLFASQIRNCLSHQLLSLLFWAPFQFSLIFLQQFFSRFPITFLIDFQGWQTISMVCRYKTNPFQVSFFQFILLQYPKLRDFHKLNLYPLLNFHKILLVITLVVTQLPHYSFLRYNLEYHHWKAVRLNFGHHQELHNLLLNFQDRQDQNHICQLFFILFLLRQES